MRRGNSLVLVFFSLLLLSAVVWGQSNRPCTTTVINNQGTAGADITIDATAGGVAVLAINSSRCAAILYNSGSAEVRCAPTSLTVTSTVGFPIGSGQALNLTSEVTQAWNCIRTTGVSSTVAVLESRP